MIYYKVLNNKREAVNDGHGKWLYRKWMPSVKVNLCNSGYHVCTRDQLIYWLDEALWEVEIRGKISKQSDKIIASEARLIRKLKTWNKRTQRLFACDCAEHVLRYAPPTDRPMLKNIIDTSRRYANGNATDKELAAARAAVGATTAWAAWAAARWTAWMAITVEAPWTVRAAAVREAVWVAQTVKAAWTTAAGVRPEHKWQTQRLFEYLDGKRK